MSKVLRALPLPRGLAIAALLAWAAISQGAAPSPACLDFLGRLHFPAGRLQRLVQNPQWQARLAQPPQGIFGEVADAVASHREGRTRLVRFRDGSSHILLSLTTDGRTLEVNVHEFGTAGFRLGARTPGANLRLSRLIEGLIAGLVRREAAPGGLERTVVIRAVNVRNDGLESMLRTEGFTARTFGPQDVAATSLIALGGGLLGAGQVLGLAPLFVGSGWKGYRLATGGTNYEWRLELEPAPR